MQHEVEPGGRGVRVWLYWAAATEHEGDETKQAEPRSHCINKDIKEKTHRVCVCV